MPQTPILVTGAAGFIGMQVTRQLLKRGHAVFGLDNLNSYYDPLLKEERLKRLTGFAGFQFQKADIADRKSVKFVRQKSFLAGRASCRASGCTSLVG